MSRSPRSPHFLGRFLLVTTLALLFSTGQTAKAQGHEEDFGLWGMLMMEGPIGGGGQTPSRFRWWLDIQPRFLDDVSGLQQGLLRPGIGYLLGEQTSAWLGYARVHTESENGATSDEDRIWQQFLWKPRLGDVGFQSRTRLEQRFLDSGSDTGWRFRQFVKAGWDLPSSSHLSLVAYDEVFLDMNDTNWGQRSGFAQNRVFAGLGVKLGGQTRSKIEVGYLNQILDGSGAREMNHILSINLFLNF